MENIENNQQVKTKVSSETSDKQAAKESEEISLPTPEELGIITSEAEEVEPKNDNEDDKSTKNAEKPQELDSKEEETENKPREYSDVEKKAIEKGWIPKEQFKGDLTNWREAREYIDRGELLETITSYHKEVKGLRKTNDKMVNFIQKMSEKMNDREEQELLYAQNQAIELGDTKLANDYAKKIAESQTAKQENPVLDPSIVQFQEDNNDWFNVSTVENKMMRDFAISTDNWLAQQYPSLTIPERLQQVKAAVKKSYTHRFNPVNPETSKKGSKAVEKDYKPDFPTVESYKRATVKQKIPTYNDLPENEKTMVRNFCRYNKSISKDEYAKQLFNLGYVKN